MSQHISTLPDSPPLSYACVSPELLLAAVENSSDLISITDPAGNFLLVNHTFLDSLALSREEILGKHFRTILSPSNSPAFLNAIETSLSESGAWHGECLLTRTAADDLPVAATLYTLRNPAGSPIGQFLRFQNISGSMLIEKSLRESEQKFRHLADNIREVFFILETNPTRNTYISPAYDEIFGRPGAELNSNPSGWIDSVYPSERDAVAASFAEGLQGLPTDFEYRILRPDGGIRHIHARTFPVRDDAGTLIRIVGIAEDFTLRKQRDDALGDIHQKLNSALLASETLARDAVRLTELVEILQSCLTVAEAYKMLSTMLHAIFSTPAGALCVITPSRNVVEVASSWGKSLASEKIFAPEDCWALRRSRVHRVTDPASSLRCAHVTGNFTGGYVCVPLAAQGEALGILFVEDNSPAPVSSPRTLSAPPDALELQAVSVGGRISLALSNLRLREALRSQSIRDPLTSLFNRRYLEESLERELRRATRHKLTFALLMIDIDHFKTFNDSFGRPAGDALLQAFGNFLSTRTRGQDVAARYGGEEFALILAESSTVAARTCAELLREDLKKLVVHFAGELLGQVTISIGISSFPDNGSSAEQLIIAADSALYNAKKDGRDCIVLAPPLAEV